LTTLGERDGDTDPTLVDDGRGESDPGDVESVGRIDAEGSVDADDVEAGLEVIVASLVAVDEMIAESDDDNSGDRLGDAELTAEDEDEPQAEIVGDDVDESIADGEPTSVADDESDALAVPVMIAESVDTNDRLDVNVDNADTDGDKVAEADTVAAAETVDDPESENANERVTEAVPDLDEVIDAVELTDSGTEKEASAEYEDVAVADGEGESRLEELGVSVIGENVALVLVDVV